MNTTIVTPTIKNLALLGKWKNKFSECSLIFDEDYPDKQIDMPTRGFKHTDYCWQEIRRDFGKDERIFLRQNVGVRSYGFWKTYQAVADVIITLDDDCFPTGEGCVHQHMDSLQSKAPEIWFATPLEHMYTRGFPYGVRGKQHVVISRGPWSNKMDTDTKTQLTIGDVNILACPLPWQSVDAASFSGTTPCGCYEELIERVVCPKGRHFVELKKATTLWLSLFG